MSIPVRVRWVFLLCLVPVSGCVERVLWVRSDPPGAEVWLEGKSVGQTPVAIPFQHYGTRSVLLRAQGRASVRRDVTLRPPVWLWFPVDFLADNLLPLRLRDEHVLELALPELDEGPAQEDGMLQRAAELKDR